MSASCGDMCTADCGSETNYTDENAMNTFFNANDFMTGLPMDISNGMGIPNT